MTALEPWQQNFLTLYGLQIVEDAAWRNSIRVCDSIGHTWTFHNEGTPATWVATYIGTTHFGRDGKHYTIGQRP